MHALYHPERRPGHWKRTVLREEKAPANHLACGVRMSSHGATPAQGVTGNSNVDEIWECGVGVTKSPRCQDGFI